MEDMPGFLLPAAFILGIALFLYTFRNGAADILYLSLKRWHHTLFIAVCLCAGVFVGAYNSHLSSLAAAYDFRLALHAVKQTEDERLAGTIDACKKFVEAKLEGRADYDEPSPPLSDVIRIGAKSYWDTCAVTFGMHYWKHDIFIRGQEAGPMLCKAYRKGAYRSGSVENWCATVLIPARKA